MVVMIICCSKYIVLLYVFFFFFFKQKTAYEMRISDWSSDVCSSDLEVRDLLIARHKTEDFQIRNMASIIATATETQNTLTILLGRSEEHTSELQSLMRISYAVFCLKKKMNKNQNK